MINKPILHLNVKKKWFDMIKSGEKKEEYRDSSNYWMSRIGNNIKIKKLHYHPTDVIICFSNGYAKNRPQIFIECKGLHLGIGKKEWGASDEQQFILSLGQIL
jgi:hypothetical protein